MGGKSARGEDALYGRAAVASGGLFDALGNLRDSRAAAAGRPLDCSPGLPHREHSADAVIAFDILRAALIATFCLRLRLPLSLPAAPIVVVLRATAASISSSMPLIASNMRTVNSSPALVAIVHDVGRSSATTRTCRAVNSVLRRSQSAAVRRDKRSTCSTRRISPGSESASSRNSSGRASFAPLSFSV
jgi:hypothetical protein